MPCAVLQADSMPHECHARTQQTMSNRYLCLCRLPCRTCRTNQASLRRALLSRTARGTLQNYPAIVCCQDGNAEISDVLQVRCPDPACGDYVQSSNGHTEVERATEFRHGQHLGSENTMVESARMYSTYETSLSDRFGDTIHPIAPSA